jgi:hypothetical protein
LFIFRNLIKKNFFIYLITLTVNNLNKEKVEGIYIQALNEKTNQIQETVIDKNGEYRLKGLTPGYKYIIRVKIPSTSCNLFYL